MQDHNRALEEIMASRRPGVRKRSTKPAPAAR
jgi:hypothetical protein